MATESLPGPTPRWLFSGFSTIVHSPFIPRLAEGQRATVVSPPVARRVLAEFLGTAFLAGVVVGSGIAAERLSHDVGLQLLENAAATAGGLVALIYALGPVSGAHFNPLVSVAAWFFDDRPARELLAYIGAQVSGAVAGTAVANVMFELPLVEWSHHNRSGTGVWLGEVVATFGLLLVVFGVVRSGRANVAPIAVGAYIGAAYFFTSSTSFANPAIAVGRSFSDTFAGISPGSVPAFVAFEIVGGALALLAIRVLYPDAARVSDAVVVPHEAETT